MELVLVLLRQMIVMFLLMVVGYWLFKTGRVSLQGNKELGTVLLYVILPCAIVNSYISVDSTEISGWRLLLQLVRR